MALALLGTGVVAFGVSRRASSQENWDSARSRFSPVATSAQTPVRQAYHESNGIPDRRAVHINGGPRSVPVPEQWPHSASSTRTSRRLNQQGKEQVGHAQARQSGYLEDGQVQSRTLRTNRPYSPPAIADRSSTDAVADSRSRSRSHEPVQTSRQITSRNRVSANQWRGPTTRPVQRIQQVNHEQWDEITESNTTVPVDSLLSPFRSRASEYPIGITTPIEEGQLRELPEQYAPWWDEVINQSMRAGNQTLKVDAESLVLDALEHSPQVTATRIEPVLREMVILEEESEFDWAAFLETKYDDGNEPIGNSLTAQGSTRFKDNVFSSQAGLRKRTTQGGDFDISQKIGYQDNNSNFFIPKQQGTARMEVNFRQPLMRGAGRTVNLSRTVLAMLDHDIAGDELQDRLQNHLVTVYQGYWYLYRARAIRLQKLRVLDRAQKIHQMLEARKGVDSVKRQVLRARAAVASRRSEIVRADMAIRNAESQLRLLVNSPDLRRHTRVELLPTELPMSAQLDVSMRGSIETAIQSRPDVARSMTRLKATSLRLGVAKNDLLPRIDLFAGAYTAGLKGGSEVGLATSNQFRTGGPGYSIGLYIEYPLGNRGARARHARREWELARALKEFEVAVETGMTEVELAVREMETSYQEMLSRFQSMIAADTEANYLMTRWQKPVDNQTTSFLLEDLLEAQERVAAEEAEFVNAQVDYVLAIVELKRSAGILLNCDSGNDITHRTVRGPSASPASESETAIPAPAPARARAPARAANSPSSPPPLKTPPPSPAE